MTPEPVFHARGLTRTYAAGDVVISHPSDQVRDGVRVRTISS